MGRPPRKLNRPSPLPELMIIPRNQHNQRRSSLCRANMTIQRRKPRQTLTSPRPGRGSVKHRQPRQTPTITPKSSSPLRVLLVQAKWSARPRGHVTMQRQSRRQISSAQRPERGSVQHHVVPRDFSSPPPGHTMVQSRQRRQTRSSPRPGRNSIQHQQHQWPVVKGCRAVPPSWATLNRGPASSVPTQSPRGSSAPLKPRPGRFIFTLLPFSSFNIIYSGSFFVIFIFLFFVGIPFYNVYF